MRQIFDSSSSDSEFSSDSSCNTFAQVDRMEANVLQNNPGLRPFVDLTGNNQDQEKDTAMIDITQGDIPNTVIVQDTP